MKGKKKKKKKKKDRQSIIWRGKGFEGGDAQRDQKRGGLGKLSWQGNEHVYVTRVLSGQA